MATSADIDKKIVHLDDQTKPSPRSYWLQAGCIPARSRWNRGGGQEHQGHFGDLLLPSRFFCPPICSERVRKRAGCHDGGTAAPMSDVCWLMFHVMYDTSPGEKGGGHMK